MKEHTTHSISEEQIQGNLTKDIGESVQNVNESKAAVLKASNNACPKVVHLCKGIIGTRSNYTCEDEFMDSLSRINQEIVISQKADEKSQPEIAIQGVWLREKYLNDQCLMILLPTLFKATNLQFINLQGNALHDDSIKPLSKCLSHMTNLRHLNISNNFIGWDTLEDLIKIYFANENCDDPQNAQKKSFLKLRYLDVSGNLYSNNTVDLYKTISYIQCPGSLALRDANLCYTNRKTKPNPFLMGLDIAGAILYSDVMQFLSTNNLTSLDLSFSFYDEASVVQQSKNSFQSMESPFQSSINTILNLASLRTLSLSLLSLTNYDLQCLSTGLIEKNINLVELDLSFNEISEMNTLISYMCICKTVRFLDLSGNYFDSRNINNLCIYLKTSTSLLSLSLSFMNFKPEAFVFLAEALEAQAQILQKDGLKILDGFQSPDCNLHYFSAPHKACFSKRSNPFKKKHFKAMQDPTDTMEHQQKKWNHRAAMLGSLMFRHPPKKLKPNDTAPYSLFFSHSEFIESIHSKNYLSSQYLPEVGLKFLDLRDCQGLNGHSFQILSNALKEKYCPLEYLDITDNKLSSENCNVLLSMLKDRYIAGSKDNDTSSAEPKCLTYVPLIVMGLKLVPNGSKTENVLKIIRNGEQNKQKKDSPRDSKISTQLEGIECDSKTTDVQSNEAKFQDQVEKNYENLEKHENLIEPGTEANSFTLEERNLQNLTHPASKSDDAETDLSQELCRKTNSLPENADSVLTEQQDNEELDDTEYTQQAGKENEIQKDANSNLQPSATPDTINDDKIAHQKIAEPCQQEDLKLSTLQNETSFSFVDVDITEEKHLESNLPENNNVNSMQTSEPNSSNNHGITQEEHLTIDIERSDKSASIHHEESDTLESIEHEKIESPKIPTENSNSNLSNNATSTTSVESIVVENDNDAKQVIIVTKDSLTELSVDDFDKVKCVISDGTSEVQGDKQTSCAFTVDSCEEAKQMQSLLNPEFSSTTDAFEASNKEISNFTNANIETENQLSEACADTIKVGQQPNETLYSETVDNGTPAGSSDEFCFVDVDQNSD